MRTVRVERKRLLPVLVFALVAATALSVGVGTHLDGVTGWYGLAVFGLLLAKLLASVAHKPVASETVPDLRVAAIVPFYNEDPNYLTGTIRSLLAQTYRPALIVLVDDGSTDTRAAEVARRAALSHPEVLFIPFDRNQGKREGLGAGFRAAAEMDLADVFLCVDSDTVLEPDALAEALKPMADDEVKGVTGLVLASNHRTNLLTRLIDLRYANAFLYERAAYSKAGSVLCACGSLALYRKDVVMKYLDDFLGQMFLGQKAIFGDDRRLTNYCLLEGKVVLQETAVAWTAVPEKMSHYIRQQIRWNKSFFRESLWVVQSMTPRKPAFWLSLMELSTWITFTLALIIALVVRPVLTGQVLLVTYGVYLILLGYARSVRYFEVIRADVSLLERVSAFLLAPLYGLMHLTLLLPLRIYSLLTLNRGKWGTREHVEVVLAKEGRAEREDNSLAEEVFEGRALVSS